MRSSLPPPPSPPQFDNSLRAIYHEGEGRQIAEQWLQIFNCGENYSIISRSLNHRSSHSLETELSFSAKEDATF
jgi:hypothetical protein